MSETTSAAPVVVPVKAPESEGQGPPSLAEPASEPVAEMSGALHKEENAPAPQASPAQIPSNLDEKPSAPTTAVNGEAESTQKDSAMPEEKQTIDVAEPTTTVEAPKEHSKAEEDTEMKEAVPEATVATISAPEDHENTNGAAASKPKRKSTGGVPEHKSKTLKKKQSKTKMTNLDAKPGEYYLARLKSYPPWPSVICDEEMLPEVLLKSRPRAAKKDDGTYYEDYADGGKNVTQRSFPVMFLHTNEFGWIPNTELTPLTAEEAQEVSQKSKGKTLLKAFEVAAKGYDLDHFKEMLGAHDAAMQEEYDKQVELAAAAAEEKKAKKEKKKRKSEVKVDTDVDMDDADEEQPKKASKKRKKGDDEEDEGNEKPAKTPKTTKLKLTTGKTPSTDKKTEKKATKPKADKKKKNKDDDEEEVDETLPVDPVEARKDREREVLFLRHKLQKGFLSKDQEPIEAEMPQMATYIKKLEAYGSTLDVQTIRVTKINKVLKGIIKLTSIPKDDEYHFKERSTKLLGEWNSILGAEPADAEKSNKDDKASPAATNGVHKENTEDKVEEKVEANDDEKTEEKVVASKPTESKSEDVEMKDETSAEVSTETVEKAEPPKPVEETKTEEPKTEESAPAVLDKAPASATAAAEAVDVVKANE